MAAKFKCRKEIDKRNKVKVQVKESRNTPGVAQRVPGGLGSQIAWHSAHEGGEVVSLTHRPPLPPEIKEIRAYKMFRWSRNLRRQWSIHRHTGQSTNKT